MKRVSFAVAIFMFVFVSCEKESVEPEKAVSSADLAFKVSFDEDFENTLYPSLVLGLSNYTAREGASFELIDYSWINPKDDCDFKVSLSSSKLNVETDYQEHLDLKGESNSVYPMINWDYDALRTLNQSGTTDLSFSCYINGEEIDNTSLRVNYRSVNECVYGIINSQGEYVDMKWMFAGYVNEDHPSIDGILQEVLNTGIVNAFTGYQSDEVLSQVFAIWYYLQLQNVKYSSITNTSNPSDKIFTQHVRFFDEVIDNAQANCVDGSVFLSSILKKIDIKPFLVLIPGHMYMGFYTKSDKSSFQLLETTMIGNIDLNEIYEDDTYVYNLDKYIDYISTETYDGYFSGLYTLEYVKKEISANSFISAVVNNIPQWDNNFSKFNDSSNPQYQILDIENLRQLVQPIR